MPLRSQLPNSCRLCAPECGGRRQRREKRQPRRPALLGRVIRAQGSGRVAWHKAGLLNDSGFRIMLLSSQNICLRADQYFLKVSDAIRGCVCVHSRECSNKTQRLKS